MKKNIVVGSTLVALALSLTLFAVSVFAAMGQVFGVNNKITFIGTGEYVVFNLSGEITGTTKKGSQTPKFNWNYDYSKANTNYETWNLEEVLAFNQEGVEPGEEAIIYSFSITNLSVGGKKIRVYIEPPSIDNEVLKCEITGTESSPIIIDRNQTGNTMLKLMPKDGYFSGARDCNFNIVIQPI